MPYLELPSGNTKVSYSDSPSLDAFGRLRISSAVSMFDGQLTHDLQPLIYEQVTNGVGATIAHDATNRRALMTFSATPTGGKAFMQTYQYFRYQPGKSQTATVTFNMVEGVANVEKFAGYSDGTNGIEFVMVGLTPSVRILTSSSAGNETVAQSAWNLDKLDGTGPSGKTLDISKGQIFSLDFQALYLGRVRVGFNIDGVEYYVHQFNHANVIAPPYIANANLPIRCGMTCTGTVSTTMYFNCAGVASESGVTENIGYSHVADGSVTAASGARTHILSVRPKTTFNGIANRGTFILESIQLLVTGTNPVHYELCIGQAISGTTTFNDVNATYSAYEYNTLGTISGSPAIVFECGYIAATNQIKNSVEHNLSLKYPITLDVAGAVRSLGTVSLLVTGIGGTSACVASMNWREVR